MVVDSDDVFYLGDQPVVLERPLEPKNVSGLGFDVEGIDAYMPLAPKCALYMPCQSISQKIIARYHDAMAAHRTIRSAVLRGIPGGTAELIESQNSIRRSHELYEAFTRQSPIRAITPYVERVNALQCSWAHASVYSNRKDFTFAQRVFRESPQYRSTPGTSILEIQVTVPVSEGN